MLAKLFLLAVLALTVLCFSGAEAAMVEVNNKNYESIVKDPSKDVFLLMYASWCGHCQRMKPQWYKLAEAFPKDGDVVIAMVDADKERDVARALGAKGFPTIKLFPKNNKEGIEYEGKRTEAAFRVFLKRQLK